MPIYRDMRYPKSAKRISLIVLSCTVLTLGLISCNGTPTGSGGGNGSKYTVRGILVVDLNRSKTQSAIQLTRNSSKTTTASVALDTAAFQFAVPSFLIDSVYSYSANSPRVFAAGQHSLYLHDTTLLADTVGVAVPDTFTILTHSPVNRTIVGSGTARFTWSGSTGANGYFIAAALRSHAYPGYSAYVTTGQTAQTIPPEAFSPSPGPTPDTGWYDIYVCSYTGVPDSTLFSSFLSAPFPTQLTDNVDRIRVAGRFGTVLVARKDSIHVIF